FAETINSIIANPAGIVYKQDARGSGDPQRRRPDISKAKDILDWDPKVDLDEGLAHTIPYFKEKMGRA
ncbi:unnamed protein product, partial [marine sediment metagenome]